MIGARQTLRQQADLISLIRKIRGWEYTRRIDTDKCIDRWTDKDGYTDTQQGDPISLLLFFKIRKWAEKHNFAIRIHLETFKFGASCKRRC
jgi:hypothetical protein